MPDLIVIAEKWWKRMAALTIAALLVALVVLLLLPKKYVSTVTALPANSVATDKASVFNSNIQGLYSTLGSPDELDRFLGTARLDTIYISVAKAHNLQQHYGMAQGNHALYKAAMKLKKETKIERTEYGELQINVWDVDRNMAAALANSLMQQLQQLHQQLQSGSNALVLQKLKEAYAGVKRNDSIHASAPAAQLAAEYERLIAEYSLMVNTNPPALLVVEGARPAGKADKPYLWPTLLLTFFAAVLFSFLAVLVLESRRAKNV